MIKRGALGQEGRAPGVGREGARLAAGQQDWVGGYGLVGGGGGELSLCALLWLLPFSQGHVLRDKGKGVTVSRERRHHDFIFAHVPVSENLRKESLGQKGMCILNSAGITKLLSNKRREVKGSLIILLL